MPFLTALVIQTKLCFSPFFSILPHSQSQLIKLKISETHRAISNYILASITAASSVPLKESEKMQWAINEIGFW